MLESLNPDISILGGGGGEFTLFGPPSEKGGLGVWGELLLRSGDRTFGGGCVRSVSG